MTVASQPAILLLSADRRELRRWAAAVGSIAAHIWQSVDEVPDDDALAEHPLVVVTDEPYDPLRHPKLRQLAALEHGLVRLGSGDSSELLQALGQLAANKVAPSALEIELPVDVAARELALVCRLLGEIVLLRRVVCSSRHEREQLREQALTDILTGLPNRRAWDKELSALPTSSGHDSAACVVAIFDLDHFKQVNDRAGHVVGDSVLRAAGQALAASIRRHDFVARLGGDEFGLILTQLAAESVVSVIARLRDEVARATSKVTLPGITVSVGYASSTGQDRENAVSGESAALFAAADAALRQAKNAGRDRAVAAQLAEP